MNRHFFQDAKTALCNIAGDQLVKVEGPDLTAFLLQQK